MDEPAPIPKKRRRPIAATEFTKTYYEDRGWRIAYVERYVHQCRQSFDAFGFADHIVFHAEKKIVRLINSTGLSNLADRVRKVLSNPRAYEWLASDPATRRIDVIGWERGKHRGDGPRGVHRSITLEMFKEGKPPELKPAPVKCRYCGIFKTDQVAFSRGRVCAVCSLTENPPSATRLRQAEQINAGISIPQQCTACGIERNDGVAWSVKQPERCLICANTDEGPVPEGQI